MSQSDHEAEGLHTNWSKDSAVQSHKSFPSSHIAIQFGIFAVQLIIKVEHIQERLLE